MALEMIEMFGGRIVIDKVNNDNDNLISSKSYDVKFMGDRPSIGYQKHVIENAQDLALR